MQKAANDKTPLKPLQASFQKRVLTFRSLYRDPSIFDEFMQLGAKIAPNKVLEFNGRVNYTYDEILKEFLDKCVNPVNVHYFTNAEIELANVHNEVLLDFKNDTFVVKQKPNENRCWAYIREKLKDAGKRAIIHVLITAKNDQSQTTDKSLISSRLQKPPPLEKDPIITHSNNVKPSEPNHIMSRITKANQPKVENPPERRVSMLQTTDNKAKPSKIQNDGSRSFMEAELEVKQLNKMQHAGNVPSEKLHATSDSKNSKTPVSKVPTLNDKRIDNSIKTSSSTVYSNVTGIKKGDSPIINVSKVHLHHEPKGNNAEQSLEKGKVHTHGTFKEQHLNPGKPLPFSNPFKGTNALAHISPFISDKKSHHLSSSSKIGDSKFGTRISASVKMQAPQNISLDVLKQKQNPKSLCAVPKTLAHVKKQAFEPPIQHYNRNILPNANSKLYSGGIELLNSKNKLIHKNSSSTTNSVVLKDSSNLNRAKLPKPPTPLSNHKETEKKKQQGGLALLKALTQARQSETTSDSKRSELNDDKKRKNLSSSKIIPDGNFKIPDTPMKKTKMSTEKVEDPELKDLNLKIPYNVKLAAIDFGNPHTILGRGGQGCVKKAIWLNEDCAVKEMEIEDQGSLILKEILLTSYAIHPNIVQLRGIAREPNKLHLILEYVDCYNLREVIFRNTSLQITPSDKQFIAVKTLNAINFLHMQYEGKPAIIHADIKPGNILIGKKDMMKNWL